MNNFAFICCFQSIGKLQEPIAFVKAAKGDGLTFYSDAKAENGKAFIGGYLWGGQEVVSWYAAEGLPSWALWAFIKNDPQRTIASLELLGTLVCVKLCGDLMSKKTTEHREHHWGDGQSGQ